MGTEIGNGVLSAVLVQFAPKSAKTMEDVDYNTDRILEFMDRAVTGFPGIDMIVFPECCFQGMCPNLWIKVALKMDSEPIRRVQAKCRELGVWGVFDPWIKPENGGFIENTAIIINDEGEIVHRYVKMNPWLPWEPTAPGHSCGVCQGPKGSRLAVIICADSNYQEIWREAVHNGANVILHVSHWMGPYEEYWKLSNRAGAYFNNVHVLAVNSVGMDEAFVYCGDSMIVDTNGNIIAEAPVGIEWMLRADISPLAADATGIQACGVNRVWESSHRGASCPGQGGQGLGYEDYTVYQK